MVASVGINPRLAACIIENKDNVDRVKANCPLYRLPVVAGLFGHYVHTGQ